jgi:hypothetical protein
MNFRDPMYSIVPVDSNTVSFSWKSIKRPDVVIHAYNLVT